MKAIKVVAFGTTRDVSQYEKFGGGLSRAVIGETEHHILVEVEGSDTLWKIRVPVGFIQAIGEKEL